MKSVYKAIVPLFYFDISQIIVRKMIADKIIEYYGREEEKIRKGIEIVENIRIRRIKREDINKIGEFPSVDLIGQYEPYFSKINDETFVIEILSKDEKDLENNIEKIINKILLAMRIYKPISVFCKIAWFLENDNVTGFAIFDSHLPAIDKIFFLNTLSEFDEIKKIGKLVKKIEEINFDKRRSFRIAFSRFNRAYEEYIEDEIIIDFMIAFEALFVKKEIAGSSIKEKIVNGCSNLLGENDQEKKEIKNFLEKAWSMRNCIVHGSEFETPIQIGKRKYETRDFILQLQQYLSDSLKKLI